MWGIVVYFIIYIVTFFFICDNTPFIGFSSFSIVMVTPLAIFIASYLKYRTLEIKVRHRIALLKFKEAKTKRRR